MAPFLSVSRQSIVNNARWIVLSTKYVPDWIDCIDGYPTTNIRHHRGENDCVAVY